MTPSTPLRAILDSSRGLLRISSFLGIATRVADPAPERRWPAFRAPQIMEALLAIDDAMALPPFISREFASAWDKPRSSAAYAMAKDAFSPLRLCATQASPMFAVDGLALKCSLAKSAILSLGLSSMEGEALMAHALAHAGIDIVSEDNGLALGAGLASRLMHVNFSRGLSNSILLEVGVGMLGSAIFHQSVRCLELAFAKDEFSINGSAEKMSPAVIFGWSSDAPIPSTHGWAMDILSSVEGLWDPEGSPMDGVSHARLSALLRFHDEYMTAAKLSERALSMGGGGCRDATDGFPDFSGLRSILDYAVSPEAFAGQRVAATAQDARDRLDGARLNDKISERRSNGPLTTTSSAHGL